MSLENNIVSSERVNVGIKKADTDSEKYKVALKLINLILVNLGKDLIDDLTKFVNIDREDIIKDINKQSLIGMEKELFPLFNKKSVGYYRKTDALVLNCLRGMMKEIGFELYYEEKEKSEYVNERSLRRKHLFYFIK
jgi:hypothetical protein